MQPAESIGTSWGRTFVHAVFLLLWAAVFGSPWWTDEWNDGVPHETLEPAWFGTTLSWCALLLWATGFVGRCITPMAFHIATGLFAIPLWSKVIVAPGCHADWWYHVCASLPLVILIVRPFVHKNKIQLAAGIIAVPLGVLVSIISIHGLKEEEGHSHMSLTFSVHSGMQAVLALLLLIKAIAEGPWWDPQWYRVGLCLLGLLLWLHTCAAFRTELWDHEYDDEDAHGMRYWQGVSNSLRDALLFANFAAASLFLLCTIFRDRSLNVLHFVFARGFCISIPVALIASTLEGGIQAAIKEFAGSPKGLLSNTLVWLPLALLFHATPFFVVMYNVLHKVPEVLRLAEGPAVILCGFAATTGSYPIFWSAETLKVYFLSLLLHKEGTWPWQETKIIGYGNVEHVAMKSYWLEKVGEYQNYCALAVLLCTGMARREAAHRIDVTRLGNDARPLLPSGPRHCRLCRLLGLPIMLSVLWRYFCVPGAFMKFAEEDNVVAQTVLIWRITCFGVVSIFCLHAARQSVNPLVFWDRPDDQDLEVRISQTTMNTEDTQACSEIQMTPRPSARSTHGSPDQSPEK